MNMYNRQDIIDMVEEEDVRFIRLQFADIFGQMKNMAITVSQLERALDNRMLFDCSSIAGFSNSEDCDLFLHPILDTFEIFPWRPRQGQVARLICDICDENGNPYAYDSRNVLKRVLEDAKQLGYEFKVSPECEFFLFNTDEDGNPTNTTNDDGGYFDVAPLDNGENCRREIVMTLEDMGYEVEESHHEVAGGQHEVDFKYDEAMITADRLLTFKMVVKTVAKRNGYFATFMPKPLNGVNGSGMHLNMSVYKDGKNLFDTGDEVGDVARSFAAGILKYAPEICCLTNPTVNSYKRLIPGYNAPSYISWSKKNNSHLLRIPRTKGRHARVELRSPDPTANPYLAIAAALAAGLEGIKQNMTPPPSVDCDMSKLSEEEIEALGVKALPVSLRSALNEAKKSEFLEKLLGKKLMYSYIKAKEAEYEEYRNNVSSWEVEKYLIRY